MDNLQYLSKKQKTLLISIPIIFITIIIISLFFYFQQKPKQINIIGLNEKTSSTPILDKDTLKAQLYRVILLNPDIKNSEISDAVLRDNSYSEETKDGITTANFIVDIDSIKQSYTISFSWSETEELSDSILIECPNIFESKYPNSYCIGMYTTSDSPELYLPYQGTTNSGVSYQINFKFYTGDEPFIEVSTKDCQNLNEAKAAAEVWLNTTPLKSLYPIEVKRFCE